MSRKIKDSGIKWIGAIPEDWEVRKVKDIFLRKKSEAKQEDPIILSLARDGIKIRDISNNEGQLATSYYNYNPVEAGDFLINPMDLYSGANCNVSLVEGVISPAYVNLRANNGNVARFFDYYFKTQYWAMALFAHGKGVSYENRWTLNNEALMNYFMPVPNIQEQQKIAIFLDQNISDIDHILEKTRESIEEYKKYKQSIITEAVTKGLNPNVEMKDSGIEWIGEIPKHWEVTKLKKIIESPLQYGANSSGVNYDENLPRYIRITDITTDNKLKEDGKLSLPIQEAEQFILKNNDILFARSGGTVGKTFIYKDIYGLSAFAGYLIKAEISKSIKEEFIYYYTLSSAYNEWKNRIFIQSTIQNIGADKYSNMEIVMPTEKKEQDQIVNYLDYKCTEIDSLISQKESLLKNLELYKKSLIYESVTGKREVM